MFLAGFFENLKKDEKSLKYTKWSLFGPFRVRSKSGQKGSKRVILGPFWGPSRTNVTATGGDSVKNGQNPCFPEKHQKVTKMTEKWLFLTVFDRFSQFWPKVAKTPCVEAGCKTGCALRCSARGFENFWPLLPESAKSAKIGQN